MMTPSIVRDDRTRFRSSARSAIRSDITLTRPLPS
jgi:hypothetical protein